MADRLPGRTCVGLAPGRHAAQRTRRVRQRPCGRGREARTEMSATADGRPGGQVHVRHPALDTERDRKCTAAPFSPATADPGLPPARGMYDPALDKDSC